MNLNITMDHSEILKLAIDVIPSVVANGITSALSSAGRFVSGAKTSKVAERISTHESVSTALQKATAAVARDLAGNTTKISQLKEFLVSPELDAIVSQVYSVKVAPADSSNALTNIKNEFLLSAALHVNLTAAEIKPMGELLFDAVLKSCDEVLNQLIAQGSLLAIDAKSSYRHNIMLEQLAAIRRNIELLHKKDAQDVHDFLEFEKKYRFQVGERHSRIIPPNLAAARPAPLEQLYVANTFAPFHAKTEYAAQFSSALPQDQFLPRINRTVVLGNPGGGKSTFSLKVCNTLAKHYQDRPIGGRLLTPVLIILRDYGAEKKIRHCSLLEFIELISNSKYQLKPPKNAFEYLLLSGRILVIFDGLDELLDTSYRREISADVESFLTLYPATAALVTSREVGYDQAPLDRKRFTPYRINEFDESQVQEYARKWFGIEDDFTPEQNEDLAKNFLKESESVSDLRSNPLILGLMCNIYRGESYIPRNRPGVYEKCALMLFDRWDRGRHLDIQFTFEDKLSPVMKYLAFWIYSDPKLQTGVTESSLIDKATEYLYKRLYDDIDFARKVAREFIEFCRGRAWVFTDTGSTAEGELLYQFTHRTFLEYFTAAQLVRIYARPSELAPDLIPRIEKEEWDIVAQLAFQLQNNNVEGAGDDLLSLVLKKATAATEQGQAVLYGFAARCLEFMLPSRKTVRAIAGEVISFALKVGLEQIPARNKGEFGVSDITRRAAKLLEALTEVAVENRLAVAQTIETALEEALNSPKSTMAQAAFDIIAGFPGPSSRPQSDELKEFWQGIHDRIVATHTLRIKSIANENARIACAAFYMNTVSMSELLNAHGLKALYTSTISLIFPMGYVPIADLLIGAYYRDSSRCAHIEAVGRYASSSPTPWVHTRALGPFNNSRFRSLLPWWNKNELNADFFFGLFAILATLLESGENRRSLDDALKFIAHTKNANIASIKDLLLLRYSESPKMEEALSSFNFDDTAKEIIVTWGAKRISLVEGGRRKRK
jgi:hypothetical protein